MESTDAVNTLNENAEISQRGLVLVKIPKTGTQSLASGNPGAIQTANYPIAHDLVAEGFTALDLVESSSVSDGISRCRSDSCSRLGRGGGW